MRKYFVPNTHFIFVMGPIFEFQVPKLKSQKSNQFYTSELQTIWYQNKISTAFRSGITVGFVIQTDSERERENNP